MGLPRGYPVNLIRAKLGYSRDGKRGKLRIVFVLLCNHEGCPVDVVEVFEGNTADPTTVRTQLETLRERFALVGDRGLPTGARIREEVRPAGFDRITALRAPQNRALVDGGDLQLSLFDERDLAEISAPELYPGERLVVCRNPLLAAKAGSQAAGAPRRHRGRTGQGRCDRVPRRTAVVGPGQDRRAGRPGVAPLQGRQALRRRVHRRTPSPASPGNATRAASRRRPSWTASTSSAPMCPPRRFRPRKQFGPERA